MGILEDIQPLIEQVTNTTNPDEVIFYAVGFFKSEKNLEELSDEDCMQIIKKLIDVNSDAQLAAELAMVIAEKKGLYSFARKIVIDKSKYTGDDWSLTKFDEKRLEVLTFTTIHDPKNCPPEIIITYDEMIESDNPVRNGWDKIDCEAPKVQFFKGYYNGEYFEVGRVYEDPYEDDNGEMYYNSYYFELESFGGDDENALENIIESINNSSYIWSEEKENLAYIDLSDKSEVEILIYGTGIKILYGCMDPETYKALEEHSDGSLEDILCDSDKLYELTKEKYLSMYELDNSQTWQGADLDAFIKIIVNNEVIVNDRFDEVFDLNKVLDYSQRANSDFGHQNYIRFTKKPAAQTTIIGNSNIKGEILKCKFETEEAFDIENLTFLILDAEDEGYSKFVEEIFYKGKFINHEGNSSYDEQGWTFDVSKPKIQDEDNQSQKTNLTISFDFDDASEKGDLTELIEKFELKYDKMIETINFLDNQFGMSQKSRYLDNMTKCKNIISTYLKSDYVNEKVVSEEWDKDFLSLITYDRTDHITITGIEDFEDHDETLKFKNIEVNAGIIELDEDLLSISEDFYIEATDEGNDLYSSYYGGEHDSGDL